MKLIKSIIEKIWQKIIVDEEAFTLIELLVVIAIIAIVASIVVLALNPAELQKKARDSVRKNDLATLGKAIGIYQVNQGQIPEGGYSTYTPPGGSGTVTVGMSNQANFLQALVDGGLIPKNPRDPINTSIFIYKYVGYLNAYIPTGWVGCGGSWVATYNGYYLYTFLENGNDPDGFVYNFPSGHPCESYNGQRAVGPGNTVMYLVKNGQVAY